MSGSPNDANGRVRVSMRFGRGACSARPVTSIDDPLDRVVRLRCDTLDDIHTSCTMISPGGSTGNGLIFLRNLESPSAVGQRSVDQQKAIFDSINIRKPLARPSPAMIRGQKA